MAPAPAPSRHQSAARPAKVRYFKGKGNAAPESDSDSSGEEDIKPVAQPVKVDKSLVAGGAGRIIPDGGVSRAIKGAGEMKVALRDVKIEGGRVVLPKSAKQEEEESEEEDESEEEEEEKPKPGVGMTAVKGEESSEYETDSEEESEEEKKPAFRPVFVKKDNRGMTQEKLIAEAEARQKAEEEAQEQRKIDSKDLAGETIRRELLEREVTDLQPDVDDTDGVDPAAEFDAWRARELKRLVRDKEAQAARDMEQEEIERRRAMPEEQRLREDMEYAQQTRDREKGEMGFLQKYYHKGAFHQDDELLKRDYTLATESAVDMSSLPSVMQVRDFGKRSRTKYTHLVDQDTSGGGWGKSYNTPAGGAQGAQGQDGQFSQGCWNCGGPHQRRDCPNNNPDDPMVAFGLTAPGGSGSGRGGYGGGAGGGRDGGYVGRSMGPPQDYGGGGNRDAYRSEGRERRFDEERRGGDRPRDGGYGQRGDSGRGGYGAPGRGRDNGYGNRGDRRDRSRSRSPGRRRDDDRRRDDRGGRDGRDGRDDRDDRDRRRRDDRERDDDRRRERR